MASVIVEKFLQAEYRIPSIIIVIVISPLLNTVWEIPQVMLPHRASLGKHEILRAQFYFLTSVEITLASLNITPESKSQKNETAWKHIKKETSILKINQVGEFIDLGEKKNQTLAERTSDLERPGQLVQTSNAFLPRSSVSGPCSCKLWQKQCSPAHTWWWDFLHYINWFFCPNACHRSIGI